MARPIAALVLPLPLAPTAVAEPQAIADHDWIGAHLARQGSPDGISAHIIPSGLQAEPNGIGAHIIPDG